MPEIHPVCAARSANRTVMDGEYHGIALTQRNHHRAGLHARPLLGQYEFAPGEIAPGLGQQDRELQRKYVLSVEILMQAVIVLGAVLEHEWGRPYLARRMAAVD